MITVSLGDLRVSIPEPKQLVGSSYDVLTGRGRLVTRRATVSGGPNEATLAFEEVPGGSVENGSFGGALTTTIKFRRDVSTVERAKNDFFSNNTRDMREAFTKHPAAITRKEFPHLVVVTFNIAAAGWEPGNSAVYAVLEDGRGALACLIGRTSWTSIGRA